MNIMRIWQLDRGVIKLGKISVRMFVKMINLYTPILAFLYVPINLGVQIR